MPAVSPTEDLCVEELTDERAPENAWWDTEASVDAKDPKDAPGPPEDLLSPRSKSAAEVLKAFRSASGLRTRDKQLTDFMAKEPDKDANPVLHARWRLACFMESSPMRLTFATLVLANCVLLGVQADHETSDVYTIIEVVFICVFTLEIIGKLIGFGVVFWSDMWNTLDFGIVATSVVQLSMMAFSVSQDGYTGVDTSTIRLLRVFKIFRMMSLLQRLNLLVQAFIRACQDIIYVTVLMLIVLYIFAILAKGFFDQPKLRESGFNVDAHFGTLAKTMCTLFQIMTMDSWYSGIARPVGEVYTGAQLFFVLFVLLASFGLLNLLTAVFIDSLNALNKEGAIEEEQEKKESKKMLLAFMAQVFEQKDTDGSGELDREEMAAALGQFREPAYQQAFASVGLDLAMIEGMVKHADADMNGRINFAEFTEGVEDVDDPVVKGDMWVQDAKLNLLVKHVGQQSELLEAQSRAIAEIDAKLSQLLTRGL